MPPRAEWLTSAGAAKHHAAWADLAARCLEPSVFNDPGFALPAVRNIPSLRRPRVLALWDDGDRRRLLGLCCIAAPWPGWPLAAWLHPQATAAFPLLDAVRAEEALVALLAATRSLFRPAGLLMQGLPQQGATLPLIEAMPAFSVTRLGERSRAVLRAGEDIQAGRGAKETRRLARRLAEQGRVTFGSARTPPEVALAVEDFLDLEARGWKGRGGTALGQSRGLAAFVRAMSASLAAETHCRLDRLDFDGRPIAVGIVLQSGPTAYFWKTAFDERFARFSPGARLAASIGETQAQESGVALTDSCAVPGHAMIDRLWPGRMTVVDVLVGPSPKVSPPLRMALLAERARRDVRAWAKRWRAARRQRRVPPPHS